MIYEPREDSYLLAKHVSAYAKGKVLDMGTGSGIQAKEAAKTADSVLAADINPEAVKEADGKITYVESNLFSNIDGKFDLIIFNPPYLPDDARVKDVALDGGRHGYEVIERFLNNANDYLTNDGKILLLFSTLSKKDKVEEFIADNCQKSEQNDSHKLDFEELFVYLIEKNDLLKELEAKKVSKVMFLAKGHRGVIYTGQLDDQKITIKTESPKSQATNRIEIEINFLKKLNPLGIGPRLLFSGDDYFAYEFVEGIRIEEFIEKNDKEAIIPVLKGIITQLQKLDELGINKEEMHHPYKHILVDKKPVLIDFERAHFTERPQNITQFCQYLLQLRLGSKGIIINKEDMIKRAKKYAEDFDIKPILEVLK